MIAQFLFLLYWLLKAFYTRDSGGLQIADYVFVLSFIVLIAENVGYITSRNLAIIIKRDKYLFIFVICVAIINFLYWIVYGDQGFLLAIAYFIFNLLVVIEFRALSARKSFIKSFYISTFLCIAVQFAIYFSGQGRWYGGERYMGTFNDPNQLGFFVMSRFFILYLIYKRIEKVKFVSIISVLAAFLMTSFLIAEAASTGMFLGMATFVFGWLIYAFLKSKAAGKTLIAIVGFACVALLIVAGDKNFINNPIVKNDFIVTRVIQKVQKIVYGGGGGGFIKDRNLQAFFAKPYYILLGAGEGGFIRFIDVAANGELHSTVLGLLFYYGIIPFIILLCWVKDNLKNKAKLCDFCVYLAIFVEMLTLINHRQSSLWILFILPSIMNFSEIKIVRKK
ncbi:MAG: hypothetical protein SOX77_01115 [Candidatus Borkfalkiaceae bacterium]|nr:hypothetical protein [Christensenellaceae bacterium]